MLVTLNGKLRAGEGVASENSVFDLHPCANRDGTNQPCFNLSLLAGGYVGCSSSDNILIIVENIAEAQSFSLMYTGSDASSSGHARVSLQLTTGNFATPAYVSIDVSGKTRVSLAPTLFSIVTDPILASTSVSWALNSLNGKNIIQ